MPPPMPPSGKPESAPAIHIPQIDGPVILPPGKDPTRETRGEVNRLVVEQVKKRSVFFETKVPKESLFAKVSSGELSLQPFVPFNATGAGEEPVFALHQESLAKRRLLKSPWETYASRQLGHRSRLSLQPQTHIAPNDHVLFAVPQNEEVITLQFGTAPNGDARPTVRITKTPAGYEMQGPGRKMIITDAPVFIGTDMKDATETKKMTEASRGSVVAEEISFEEKDVRCGVQKITSNGETYLLLEAKTAMDIVVSDSLAHRVQEQQLGKISTEQITKVGASVSLVNPEHPFRNEDSAAITPHGTGIVADGMGGYESGFYVSRLVTDVVSSIDAAVGMLQDPQAIQDMLVGSLQTAHEVLKNIPTQGDTTIAVARKVKDKKGKQYGVWANVGDTRVYLFVPNGERKLVQLSTDDNLIHRWERRAQKNNGWLPIGPEDPPMQQFADFGFVTDGTSRVFLEPWKVQSLKDQLDITPDFATYSDDTLQLTAYLHRNISDGLRNGPGENKPAEYHSGICALPEGAELILMTDGAFDSLSEALLVQSLSSGKNPIEQARAIVAKTHGLFAKHKEVLSQVPENAADPMELQRVKEDDVSVVILT